jgi:hypothetical protein
VPPVNPNTLWKKCAALARSNHGIPYSAWTVDGESVIRERSEGPPFSQREWTHTLTTDGAVSVYDAWPDAWPPPEKEIKPLNPSVSKLAPGGLVHDQTPRKTLGKHPGLVQAHPHCPFQDNDGHDPYSCGQCVYLRNRDFRIAKKTSKAHPSCPFRAQTHPRSRLLRDLCALPQDRFRRKNENGP